MPQESRWRVDDLRAWPDCDFIRIWGEVVTLAGRLRLKPQAAAGCSRGTEFKPQIEISEGTHPMFSLNSNFRKSSLHAKKPTGRRFHLERLETRQMMAGDVAATLQNGSLYLSEAGRQIGKDNSVLISSVSANTIRIEGGATANGTRSLINGAKFQDFALPGSLFVNFGGGKDKVEFSWLSGIVRLQDVSIDVGVGSAARDTDKDQVSIRNLQTSGSLSIFTGANDDQVTIDQSTIGDGAGIDRLRIFAGAGADTVSMRQSTLVRGDVEMQTYDSLSELDHDDAYLTQNVRVDKSLVARLGGGDDVFLVERDLRTDDPFGLIVSGSATVDAGAGNDTINMLGVALGDALDDRATIYGGAGVDTVLVDFGNFANLNVKTYDALTENDADHVQMQSFYVQGELSADLGGGGDKFFLTDPADPARQHLQFVDGSMHIETGAGNDEVYMEGTSVGSEFGAGDLIIRTDAGADKVTVDFSSVPYAYGYYIPEVIGNVEIQTYGSLAETDVDEVRIPVAQVVGNLSVRLGGGNDIFELMGGNTQNLFIDAGDGADTGSFGGFIEHEATVLMGAGDDYLTLGHVNADILTLNGDGGGDWLRKTQPLAVDHLFETGWEWINGKRVLW